MGNSGIECVDCGDKLLQNLLQGLSIDLCTGCRAVAAAAELFEHHLHIARADGACADDDLSVVREENEGGGNAGNVDQFIRGLRRDHAGELFVYAGNGDLIPVQPRRLDNVIAQKRIVQICLKQLFDLDRVRAGLTQICRRFERARACPDGEIFRIQYDTRQKRLRLDRLQIALIDRILQKLRHQLGSRGSRRLMQLDNSLADRIRSIAMVIDQNDAGDRFQQRPALDLTGPVRVDYDE